MSRMRARSPIPPANRHDSPPVALRPEVMKPLEKIAQTMWPGAPVIPDDGDRRLRRRLHNAAGMPTYGISGIAIDFGDVRAHGRDERVRRRFVLRRRRVLLSLPQGAHRRPIISRKE